MSMVYYTFEEDILVVHYHQFKHYHTVWFDAIHIYGRNHLRKKYMNMFLFEYSANDVT